MKKSNGISHRRVNDRKTRKSADLTALHVGVGFKSIDERD